MDLEQVHRWLDEARSGDEEAFACFLRWAYPSVFRLIFQIVPNTHDVEEILQDAFFRFYRSLKRVRAGEDPMPYMRAIAIRRAYSFLKRRRLDTMSLEEIPEGVAEVSVAGHSEDLRRIYLWADGLPPKRRLVFLLREVLGVEDAEIARLMGIGEVTVRRHASLAREMLEGAHGGR